MTTFAPQQSLPLEGALRLELPSRWQLLDVTALVAALESSEVAERLTKAAGVESAMSFVADLPSMLGLLNVSGVVLTAIRVRSADRALDLLTLALPGLQADLLATQMHEPTQVWPASAERRVFLSQGEAIERRTSSAWGGGDTSAEMPSRVQLVFTIPPTKRGAIISMFSTRAGDESTLASVARELAESVVLLAAADVVQQKPDTPKRPGGQQR